METYDLEIQKPGFLEGSLWNLRKLTPITVIFGKNGSGKFTRRYPQINRGNDRNVCLSSGRREAGIDLFHRETRESRYREPPKSSDPREGSRGFVGVARVLV